MNKKLFALGITFAVLAGSVAIARHQEKEDEKPSGLPTKVISPLKAIKIATAKVPGRALGANFEFDEGHWVYGVMVVHDHKISEIEINPETGKVGDTEDVDPAGEAKELQGDLEKAIQ